MLVPTTSGNSIFDRASSLAQQLTQSMRQEFEQLGHDLQSGNMKAAQSDFATLQQSRPFANPSSNAAAPATQPFASFQNTSSVTQAFNQLAQDLRSGNLAAARQDYTTLQNDLQNVRPASFPHGYQSPIAKGLNMAGQLAGQVGQSLQGGYVSAALQAYGLLAQNVPGGMGSSSAADGTSQSATGSVSVTA